MRAEDVPDDLVETALQAEHEYERTRWEDGELTSPVAWRDFWTDGEDQEILIYGTRVSIAAVYAEIQARALEELADGLVPGVLSKYDRRYVEDWLRFTAQALREVHPGAHDA